MRVTKEHEERRNEILDTAERLFYTKGYMKTTINDILKEIQIAKGTFYYYFKSKEEVMHAIIHRIVDRDVEVAKQIAQDTSLGVHEKLLKILLSQGKEAASRPHKDELIQHFEQPGNELIHHQTLVIIIKCLSPILGDVIKQGVQEGEYQCTRPQETIELILSGAEFIFDIGAFHWSEEEKQARILALLELSERALGAKQGSFLDMLKIF